MQAGAADGSRIDGVGQIHISVTDIDRAVAFYRDALGLTFLFRVEGQPMAFFDCGGVRLYIGVPSDAKYKTNSLVYYRVADIEAAYRRLVGLGVAFLGEPRMIHQTAQSALWMAGFQDPDGNYGQIMCEKPI